MSTAVKIVITRDGVESSIDLPDRVGEDRVLHLVAGDSADAWRMVRQDGTLGRLPPFRVLDADWTLMPLIQNASVRFCFTFLDNPLGHIACMLDFVDGRPHEISFGEPGELEADCEAWFRVPIDRTLRQFLGEISPVELLAPPAQSGGDLDAVMLVAGLLGPDWNAAQAMHPEDFRNLIAAYRALDGRTLHEVVADLET